MLLWLIKFPLHRKDIILIPLQWIIPSSMGSLWLEDKDNGMSGSSRNPLKSAGFDDFLLGVKDVGFKSAMGSGSWEQ